MNSNIKLTKETSNPQPPPPPPPPSPSPSSFSSLPEDIVVSILARISTSYYPKLFLVSKSFCSHILSKDLENARSQLKTKEDRVYACLQSRTDPCDHRWFSLWLKPDDHPCDPRWFGFWIDPDDHQDLTYCMADDEDKSTGNLLIPMPSSCSPYLPNRYERAGSEVYQIGGGGLNGPSSTKVMVCNDLVGKWRIAPSMMVARKNAYTCSVDGKIYVMGGCGPDESTYWAEVFDPKTQTWEPLPDPGTKLRFSWIQNLQVKGGRVYVRGGGVYVRTKKVFVYVIEESKWEVFEEDILGESVCAIDNILYSYYGYRCWWRDAKCCEEWRLIKGISELDRHFRIGYGIEMVSSYGGKLVIFWVGPSDYPLFNISEIWCAVISLERRRHGDDDEVWGQVEWVDLVLKVPWPYTLLRCM